VDLTARFLSDRADLSPSAASALNRVCREGPIRLTTLAAKEGVSQPSMTQLIQRLERLGFVTRLADPDDGRAARIGITGHGQALLDERKRMRRERLRALMETLTSEGESALRLSAGAHSLSSGALSRMLTVRHIAPCYPRRERITFRTL
jgi:DNA-binding MarR family transcriptional regulator